MEFKERVSHKRSITLTNRLTEAFKLVSITVTKEEEEMEQIVLDTIQKLSEGLEKAMEGIDIDALKARINELHPNVELSTWPTPKKDE